MAVVRKGILTMKARNKEQCKERKKQVVGSKLIVVTEL